MGRLSWNGSNRSASKNDHRPAHAQHTAASQEQNLNECEEQRPVHAQHTAASTINAALTNATGKVDAFDSNFWDNSRVVFRDIPISHRTSAWRNSQSKAGVTDDGGVHIAPNKGPERKIESDTCGLGNLHLCPIATEVFKDVYAEVDPPEFLNVLVEASEISDDTDSLVHFAVMAGDEDTNTEKAVRMGAFQCKSVAGFLNSYEFGGMPPPPASEMPNHVLYIGIPFFTEHPDEIIPTIESVLRNGGDYCLRVHVVLVADVAINPQTKQRVNAVPFGATWKRNDGRFMFTFLNKGLKAFTGKASSLYLINKYVKAHIAASKVDVEQGGEHQPQQPPPLSGGGISSTKHFLLLADTRIIYGADSLMLMIAYMRNHSDVIACTCTQKLYPVRWPNGSTTVEGTQARHLQNRRPTYYEWLGAPAMQQFEFEANFAASQFAYNHGGRLATLPGPCHFLDMEKMCNSDVFEQFNHDILTWGSSLATDHWLKLYAMAEDRHLSTLYATKTGFKTAWVADAQFFCKPEKTWVDMLQQQLRWQGGALAQMYITVFRPSVIDLSWDKSWAWWYTALSMLSLVQFGMCCFGNAVWCIITEFGRAYSPLEPWLRDPLTDAVIWGNFVFPWIWVGWASLLNAGYVRYKDKVSDVMMGLSLFLSAASVIVNFCSLVNPNNHNCSDDDDEEECVDYNWMKILAISFACLPIIAWIEHPSSGYKSSSSLISTSVLAFFTPVLFAPHQYSSTPLHVAARLQDLSWRGDKVMQSEFTKHSGWVKWCGWSIGWSIVVAETALVGLSQCSPIHQMRVFFHIDKIGFVIALLIPQFTPLAIGAFLAFQNAAEWFKAYIARPVTLRWTNRGLVTVTLPDESLGIAIEANAADPQGFPVVASAEAAALAQAHPQPSSPGLDSPQPSTAREYKLSFPNKNLGIPLLDQGAGQAPVVDSIPGLTDNNNTGGGNDASPQGPLRMPLAGHKLVAVNGQRVVRVVQTTSWWSSTASPQQSYDLAVGLIKRAPRPVELSFEPPHVYALEFPEQRLGMLLEDTSDTHGLPSVLSGGCAVSPSLPLTGDVVVKINEVEIDPSHPSESTYDQAVRLVASSPRPLTVEFAAPAVVVAATAATTATTAVVQPQPSTEEEVDLDALTADATDATLSGDYGAASAAFSAGLGLAGFGSSAAESERFEVLFEGEKLGVGLEAGEEGADLPVVSSSPPGRSRPAPGDFLESVNGVRLFGHADPYSHGIKLIKSSGRPLVLGFVAGGNGAVVRRPSVPAVTTVSTNANNSDNPLLFSAPSALALTDGTYEVVLEGEKLGMGLQAAEDPRDLPSVSSPPAGKALPKQGHLIVSVNGHHLQGSPDTYAKAVEIIASAGRPVTIGFQDPSSLALASLPPPPPLSSLIPPPPLSDLVSAPPLPPSAERYETTFHNGKLGMGLLAGEGAGELPVVSSAPTNLPPDAIVPEVGHLLCSVNGVALEGEADAYEKALQLITSVGRPVTLGFLPAAATAAAASFVLDKPKSRSIFFSRKFWATTKVQNVGAKANGGLELC